ncbi:MAG: hypothetical protein ACI9JN_002020 [Bacteroidia bacterium]|jgi:hypothetical protein
MLCICNLTWVSAQSLGNGISVSIPSLFLVAIRGATNTDISLGLNGPAEAGLEATNTADSTMWINYSFLKGKYSKTKSDVYVKIGAGTVPSGMALKVRAKSSSSHGKGNKGVPLGEITLTSSDQKIIQNIKSSHTGKGWGKGHNLVYSLDLTNYNIVNYTSPAVLTITYTVID